MRLQILPLILCLFVTFAAKSNSTLSIKNKVDPSNKATDTKVFTNSYYDFENINYTLEITNTDLTNPLAIRGLYLFYTGISINDRIFNKKEISYITDANLSSGTDISSINTNSASSLQTKLFNEGLFYGFAITIVLLNLVCFLLFNEKIFLYYSIAIASITSAFFYSDGLFSLIGMEGPLLNLAMQSTLLFIAIGFSALFASKYLSIKDTYPNLKLITLPLFVISGILVLNAWFSNSDLFTNLANTLLLAVVSAYFFAGILLFSKKNYAKFYVIAYCIPLIFAIDFYVLKGFGVDFLFTKTIHLKVAASIEMLILSYAIMFRMRAIKEEGELRNTEMRIFLKRQDSMSRQNVEQLVKDVYLENLIMQYDLDGLEIKLLQYISEGKTNEKIIRKLKLTEIELEEHTKDLYEKLEISEHIQEDHRMVDNQPDYIYN